MAWVTQQFVDRWHSGEALGFASPTVVAQIRRGNFRRAYRTGLTIPGAKIPGESQDKPWRPIFTQTTPWRTLPNVADLERRNDVDGQRGCPVLTLTIDNVGYIPQTGPAGLTYHTIEPGYYAPQRGQARAGRGGADVPANAWADVLTKNANVRVWVGFGAPELDGGGQIVDSGGSNGTWTFNGLIDDVDSSSDPARIAITARMGKTLTDQRIFGWTKSKQLKDPVTFADRNSADDINEVGYGARASSTQGPNAYASYVADNDTDASPSYWMSTSRSTRDVTEWVSVKLPEGRYQGFVINVPDDGMEMFAALAPETPSSGVFRADGAKQDNYMTTAGSRSWWDPNNSGLVPGGNGGFPYFAHRSSLNTGRQIIGFGAELVVGKGTELRVAFRNLQGSTGNFSAKVRTLKGRKRVRNADSRTAQWVLVTDLSDIVRVVLRWAGFDEWEVEDTGVRMSGKHLWNRTEFLMDPIQWCCEQTGFTFFIAAPSTGSSLGVPTFRRPAHLLRDPGAVVAEVRDDALLTGLQVKDSEEPLPYIIRWRGKEASGADGGTTLYGDRVKRLMYVYRPPWAQEEADAEMAGIIKHVTQYQPAFKSLDDLRMACYLTGANAAVAAHSASGEMAALPLLELDDHLGVYDDGTGTNSRVWVTQFAEQMTTGEQASWATSFSGFLLDTDELNAVIEDIEEGEAGARVTVVAPLTGIDLAIPDNSIEAPQDEDWPVGAVVNINPVGGPVKNPKPVLKVTVGVWITHTFVSDLKIAVQSPSGTEVVVFDKQGGSGHDLGTGPTLGQMLVLDDAAATSVASLAGAGPFVGAYRPSNKLSAFAGEQAKGPWTVVVDDAVGGDHGTLRAIVLTVEAGVEPLLRSPIRKTSSRGRRIRA